MTQDPVSRARDFLAKHDACRFIDDEARIDSDMADLLKQLADECERLKKEVSDAVGVYQARCERFSDLQARLQKAEDALRFYAGCEDNPSLLGHLIFRKSLGEQARSYFTAYEDKECSQRSKCNPNPRGEG